MKTRMITVTLFTLFAFATVSGAANSRVKNMCSASCHETASILEVQNTENDYTPVDSVMLDEWIATRESWEQESREVVTENTLMQSTALEDWVTGRESWEQKAEDNTTDNNYAGSVVLEQWITGVEYWEQK